MSAREAVANGTPAGGRMTLSKVLEALLAKREHGMSSVTLTRNAKGETQIEVVVRTSEDGAVTTIEEAEAVAVRTFDALRNRYPMRDGTTAGTGAAPVAAEARS